MYNPAMVPPTFKQELTSSKSSEKSENSLLFRSHRQRSNFKSRSNALARLPVCAAAVETNACTPGKRYTAERRIVEPLLITSTLRAPQTAADAITSRK